MSSPSALPENDPPPLTDSPWFWVYLFSLVGFAALFVMDGKYKHRQDHLENEFLHGTRTLERPAQTAADDPPATMHPPASAGEAAPLTTGQQPVTHELIISLWPLRTIMGVIMVVSCIVLQWKYVRNRIAARH